MTLDELCVFWAFWNHILPIVLGLVSFAQRYSCEIHRGLACIWVYMHRCMHACIRITLKSRPRNRKARCMYGEFQWILPCNGGWTVYNQSISFEIPVIECWLDPGLLYIFLILIRSVDYLEHLLLVTVDEGKRNEYKNTLFFSRGWELAYCCLYPYCIGHMKSNGQTQHQYMPQFLGEGATKSHNSYVDIEKSETLKQISM